jgi:hypothetical protein
MKSSHRVLAVRVWGMYETVRNVVCGIMVGGRLCTADGLCTTTMQHCAGWVRDRDCTWASHRDLLRNAL